MSRSNPQSIYDLPPIETGGVQNRKGIAFQDHVAAGFCLYMLEDEQLIEVWCETQDDITLVWRFDSGTVVEFAQAKSNELDKLWSISDLCAREKGKIGTSIVERSLAYDRCGEATRFRVITARPFRAELEPMTFQHGSNQRRTVAKDLDRLGKEFTKKIGACSSPNGATCDHWVQRATLDARHSEQAVQDGNLHTLRQLLEARAFSALHDQVQEIYRRLVAEVFLAGRADAATDLARKRFSRSRVEALLQKLSEMILRYPIPHGGKALEEKLEAAYIPSDTIAQAQEQRRAYRYRSLQPKYQISSDVAMIEGEVAAILHLLQCNLDIGNFPDDGLEFHTVCLEELNKFRSSFPKGAQPPLADLYGCMYVIADRCLHRFRRVKL